MGWLDLNQLIAAQHGAVALRQARDVGVPPRTLRSTADREGWQDPFPGRGVRLHPATAETFERGASAAILAVGGDAMVSRWAAAYLLGLTDRPPAVIDIVVPYRRAPDPPGPGVRIWRSRTLCDEDSVLARGIPTTAPVRTICDLPAVSSARAVRNLLIDARQRRRITIEAVMRRQALMAGTTGLPVLRRLCYELDASRCDSVLAWRARELLTAAGMPPDPSEHPVVARNGITVHFDVPFVRYLVAIEAEGMSAHAERWQLEADIRRRNTIRQTDWTVIGVTWHRLDVDADGFVAEVREELERRGWVADGS